MKKYCYVEQMNIIKLLKIKSCRKESGDYNKQTPVWQRYGSHACELNIVMYFSACSVLIYQVLDETQDLVLECSF